MKKGWTPTETGRRGYVLTGRKTMRALNKVGLVVGTALFASIVLGYTFPGILGFVLLIGCWYDYKYNTRAPTKFFPLPGEKRRVVDR